MKKILLTTLLLSTLMLVSSAFTPIPITKAEPDFNVNINIDYVHTDYLYVKEAYFPFSISFSEGYSDPVEVSAKIINASAGLTGYAAFVCIGQAGPPFCVGSVTPPPSNVAWGYIRIVVPSEGNSGLYILELNGTGLDGTARYSQSWLFYTNSSDYAGVYSRNFYLDSAELEIIPTKSSTDRVCVYGKHGTTPYSVIMEVHGIEPTMIWNYTPAIVGINATNSTCSRLKITTSHLTPTGFYYAVTGGRNPGLTPFGYQLRHTNLLTIYVKDFILKVSPSIRSIYPGGSATFNVNITSIYRWDTPVNLSIGGLPTGATGTFNPSTVNVPEGSSGYSILTIMTDSSVARATYAVTVYATGSYTKTVVLTLNIGDFEIVASPNSQTAGTGTSVTYETTVTSLGDFSEPVLLSLQGWSNFSFSPSTVTPLSGGSAISTLTIGVPSSATAGIYNLIITGTTGTQSHSANITLMVTLTPDFTLSVSPASRTIQNGSSTTYTVKITSLNGFNSPVDLSVPTFPAGSTGSFTPDPITPDPDCFCTSTLSISVPSNCVPGNYKINVTATSGTIIHFYPVTLVVTSGPTGPSCIIATATYGSELSPEVSLLRSFRDNTVMSTFAGRQFMSVFNAWYYSFSPPVAGAISDSTVVKPIMRAVLYPLIGTLHIASQTNSAMSAFGPEIAIVAAGLVASSLIGIVYLAPISLLILFAFRRYYRVKIRSYPLHILAGLVMSSGILLLIGELMTMTYLVMFSAAMLIVMTLVLSGIAFARFVAQSLKF